MRNLIKNKRPIVVLNYGTKTPVLDSDNNETGEYIIGYGNEICFSANVSGAKGDATVNVFGVDLDYDKTIAISVEKYHQLQLNENSVFFIDKKPEYNSQNKPLYDYKVKKICETLNEVVIAVKKVRNE